MFITDFDGTLLSDDRLIGQQDLKTLGQLRTAGITTVIATGRSLFSFERALGTMGLAPSDLPLDYLIFSTGAGVISWPGKELVRSQSIPKEGIHRIISCFDGHGFDYMIHKAIPDTSYFLFKVSSRNNADFSRRMEMYSGFGTSLEQAGMVYESATEVLAIVPEGVDIELMEQLRSELKEFSVIPATSPLDHKSSWIEVFDGQVSKSGTAAWLAEKLGVQQQNCVAVGNDYNDEDLLEWAGQGYLMENAPDVLKKRFACAGSNNACGVTRAAEASGLGSESDLNRPNMT